MLDPQMREEVLHVIGFYSFGRRIVHVVTLGALKHATLLRDLLFDKLIYLSLKIVVLFVNDPLFDLGLISLLRYLIIQIKRVLFR